MATLFSVLTYSAISYFILSCRIIGLSHISSFSFAHIVHRLILITLLVFLSPHLISSILPTYSSQAIYRVYRYGQTKNVFVYRLLSSGSMEEKIYKKQVTKRGKAFSITF